MWNCVRSASFSIFVTRRPKGKIVATRGIGQSDPLLPFLFLLVANVLSRLVSTSMDKGPIEGFNVGKDLVHLSHLQFADDSLFFCSSQESSFVNLNKFLSLFEAILVLKINEGKAPFFV